jgi:hypothetical protein
MISESEHESRWLLLILADGRIGIQQKGLGGVSAPC